MVDPPPETDAAAVGHYQQAVAYLEQRLFDRAIDELVASTTLSTNAVFLFDLATIHALKGDESAALVHFKRFVAVSPESDAAPIARKQIARLQANEERREAARNRQEAEVRAKYDDDYVRAKSAKHRNAVVTGVGLAVLLFKNVLIYDGLRRGYDDGVLEGSFGFSIAMLGGTAFVVGGLGYLGTEYPPRPSGVPGSKTVSMTMRF